MFEVRNRLFMSLCVLLLLVPAAGAQTVTYQDQVNLYHPTWTGEMGLFTTIAGETLRQGDWSFSIYYNNFDYLAAEPLPNMRIPSRRSFREMDIDEHRLSLSFGYGLTDRWEISAMIPWVRIENNAGDLSGFVNGYPYMGEFRDSGMGDIRISTKFALLDPFAGDSRFAFSLFAELPTGDEDSGISTGNTSFGAGAHWNRGIWAGDLRYKVTGDRDASDNPRGFDVDTANEVKLNIGTNIPLTIWPTTNWINELNTIFYTGGDSIGKPDNIVYLVTGLRHWFGTSGWALNAALRGNLTMLTSDNNSCPLGGLLGLSYAPMHLTPPPPPPAVIPPPPPPEPRPVTPPPPPVAPPREPVELRVDEIHFESGSARVTNIAKAILDDVALRMRQEPAATAIVIGYTDNRENLGPNRDLDRRRAEAVRDYLVSRHGIDPSRITVEARGTQDPVGDNATAAGRQQNRRVVIRLIVP
jgi:outer membrane protein OmpA-like peptidoglycan-associated protein